MEYGTFEYNQKAPDILEYDEPVKLGEVIGAETEYLGTVSGRLIKQSFNLNGGTIYVKSVNAQGVPSMRILDVNASDKMKENAEEKM